MRKIISIFILCCLSVALFSQQSAKPNVVIVPFDAKGVPQDEADVVT